jgi:hypothetical protein
VRNGQDEVVLAGGQGLAFCFRQFFILFLNLLYFLIVVMLDLLQAISDDHYKGITGVHLIESVHHDRKSIIP